MALLNFGSLRTPAQVFELHQAFPETRIVVLANRPDRRRVQPDALVRRHRLPLQGDRGARRHQRDPPGLARHARAAALGRRRRRQRRARASRARTCSPRARPTCSSCSRRAPPTPRSRSSLSIGVETVRTHARNIYRKLGISSRRDLARLGRPGEPVVVESDASARGLGGRGRCAAARARSAARRAARRWSPRPCAGCRPRSRGSGSARARGRGGCGRRARRRGRRRRSPAGRCRWRGRRRPPRPGAAASSSRHSSGDSGSRVWTLTDSEWPV